MIRSKLLFAGSGFWHVKNSLLLFLEEIARTTSKVYAAHALDKGIIVMTQTKNMKIWRFPPNIVIWEKELFFRGV